MADQRIYVEDVVAMEEDQVLAWDKFTDDELKALGCLFYTRVKIRERAGEIRKAAKAPKEEKVA